MRTKNFCTVCGAPGIPGLKKGNGKCQFHWNAGNWGADWAEKIKQESAQRPGKGRKDVK